MNTQSHKSPTAPSPRPHEPNPEPYAAAPPLGWRPKEYARCVHTIASSGDAML